PVEAAEADEPVRLARGGDVDVVAALAVRIVGAAVAHEDVVALHRLVADRIEIVARGAIAGAPLDPVVALVAGRELVRLVAQDEVFARAAEGFRNVLPRDDEVAAETAQDQVAAVAALDDVVAVAAVDHVVAAGVGDDVIAGAAIDLVVAEAAVQAIV